jgi:hypothetical protein
VPACTIFTDKIASVAWYDTALSAECAYISLDELGDLRAESGESSRQTHVHELGLSVHLEATLDGRVNSEVKQELLALVSRVGLEGSQHLSLLARVEGLSRDDGDLLLTVELLVQLLVSVRDGVDIVETLVLGKDLNELESDRVEVTDGLESLVEESDLLKTNTGVQGEVAEGLGVLVEALKVSDILEHGVEGALSGGSHEKDGSIATLDGVLHVGRLVIGSGCNLLDITKAEGGEQGLVDGLASLGRGGGREVSLGLRRLRNPRGLGMDGFGDLLDGLGLILSLGSLSGLRLLVLLATEGSLHGKINWLAWDMIGGTYDLLVVEHEHVGLLNLVHYSHLLTGSEGGNGRALGEELERAHGDFVHHFFSLI